MAITTYDELKASIANWLNRDDLTAVIPDFISLAEADLARGVRHWRMEKRSTATIDTRYTELPDGFLDPMRFHLGVDQQNIELTSPSELQKYRNESSDVAGRPKLYAITGGQIEVWPSPDTSYTGELYYYAKINPLSDAVSTNWVLQYYPDAYLYGSLIHSAPYLSDDQRTTVWAALYKSATDGINSNNDKAKFGGNLRLRVKSY
jgi:hypothetical protein